MMRIGYIKMTNPRDGTQYYLDNSPLRTEQGEGMMVKVANKLCLFSGFYSTKQGFLMNQDCATFFMDNLELAGFIDVEFVEV